MPIYEVVSPTQWSGYYPAESSVEWGVVRAKNPKEAKLIFVRLARELKKEWWDCSCNPFTGIKVARIPRSRQWLPMAEVAGRWTNIDLPVQQLQSLDPRFLTRFSGLAS